MSWLRTRLRTAPGAALALGLLVLVTSFLAAVLPRGMDAYETRGVRHQIESAAAPHRTIETTLRAMDLVAGTGSAATTEAFSPESIQRGQRALRAGMPAPLRTDLAQAASGARTDPIQAVDKWIPTLGPDPTRLGVDARANLAAHATVTAGRLPKGPPATPVDHGGVLEAAVTTATAKTLKMHPGSVIHMPLGRFDLRVRITGIVEPRRPDGDFWAVDPLVREPGVVYHGSPPQPAWSGALLVAPESGPVLPLLGGSQPEMYWQLPFDASKLTSQDVSALQHELASLEHGPLLPPLQRKIGDSLSIRAEVGDLVADYLQLRGAIAPVVSVAACGIATVAGVVLLMAAGLAFGRRREELTLLRSRGGSLRGIAGRLAAENAVVALPAAALGCALAVLAVDQARLWPAPAASMAVALLAVLALPVRAAVALRRPRVVGRTDLVSARPSRRRLVAELTALVLAVGAVVALRRRGTADGADVLVSMAPVLVGVIAALVFVRLYPLPLRLAAKPAARLRGAVGFLSLARAGRVSGTAALPLLALLIALTTAAFGGSVTSGVDQARDRAATLTVGADAALGGDQPLPAGAAAEARSIRGVRDVSPVWSEPGVEYRDLQVTLLAVEPRSYARLARKLGLGAFDARALSAARRNGPLPALVSPDLARDARGGSLRLEPQYGALEVRAAATAPTTPGCPRCTFAVVDKRALASRQPRADLSPTTLLVEAERADGTGLDLRALRALSRSFGDRLSMPVRSQVRADFEDSPMQSGAARIYEAAVAAGAGYALLALVLSLLQAAPERSALLARLRTMGLTGRQARRLMILEALPQSLLAAAGGALVGTAAIQLLAPGIDLTSLALAFHADPSVLSDARLHTNALALAAPSAAVLVLAMAVVLAQAWWSSHHREANELRAGETR